MIPRTIVDPGVYSMSDQEYQNDPCVEISLRSSMAWRLVEKGSTPAHAAYEDARLNPGYKREEKRHFDLGKAAHRLLLGKGAEFRIIDADDYRTKAAQQAKMEAYEANLVPLLSAEFEQVTEMTAAADRQIQAMIDAGTIEASPFHHAETEKVLIYRDMGVLCRVMADGISLDSDVLSEYKTEGVSADKEIWQWKARKLGYIFRLSFYRRGFQALRLAFSPHIRVFVQETRAPYLMAMYRIEDELIERADQEVKRAIQIWRKCRETGIFPGYPIEGFDLGLTSGEMAKEMLAPITGHIASEDIDHGPVRYVD